MTINKCDRRIAAGMWMMWKASNRFFFIRRMCDLIRGIAAKTAGHSKETKAGYYKKVSCEEVQQIRRGLAVMKDLETIKIENLIFENHWRYLDVAFMDVIWKQWKLSKIFPQSDGKDVQTSEIVEILTLYQLFPLWL